jgi:hypothetical protein
MASVCLVGNVRAGPGPEEKYEVGFGVYFAETAEEAAAMDAGTTAN